MKKRRQIIVYTIILAMIVMSLVIFVSGRIGGDLGYENRMLWHQRTILIL